MVESNAIRELVGALSPDDEKKKSDTYSAVVSHIDEEGTVWVILAGSDKETPTASTSTEVKSGDSVTVNWRNNKLYIGGNYSNPAAGVGTVMPSVDFVTELIDKEITVNSINAATGYIKDLTAEHITADDIQASSGYIKELRADGITAEDITADHATIGDLDVNYAQIDAANVTDLSAQNAWVNKIMVQTGLIAHEGTVFTLDAIQVNAANITAGTLDVNRLIVTVDGQKYLVNINPSTGTPTYEKLDGNIVEPRTITADRIVAHDITVQEITTENLVGTNGWINLNQGKFRYTTNGTTLANSTNGIEWDGTNLKIKGSVDVTAGNVYTKTESDERFGDHLYVDTTYSGSNIVFTARAILDGVDVTSQYYDGDFEWFYRTPTGDVSMNINGKSISIPQASQEYGRTVVCVFSRNQYANLLTNAGNKLRISTGAYLLGRSEY